MNAEDVIKALGSYPLQGVLYNVVRRPLSGGKGTIVQHKPTKSNPRGESKESFYNRLRIIIEEDPSYYFMRWEVGISQKDIDTFKTQCLNPILEQLCDWYEWIISEPDTWSGSPGGRQSPFSPKLIGSEVSYLEQISCHWRHPYGVYNILDEGGSSELDEYLESGSEVGLSRAEKLFTELEE